MIRDTSFAGPFLGLITMITGSYMIATAAIPSLAFFTNLYCYGELFYSCPGGFGGYWSLVFFVVGCFLVFLASPVFLFISELDTTFLVYQRIEEGEKSLIRDPKVNGTSFLLTGSVALIMA